MKITKARLHEIEAYPELLQVLFDKDAIFPSDIEEASRIIKELLSEIERLKLEIYEWEGSAWWGR